MKNCMFLLLLLTFGFKTSKCQEIIKEEKLQKSKIEEFTSKTGVILKFYDYHFPQLKSFYTSVSNNIRKICIESECNLYYQIKIKSEYGASIAEEDLLEISRAIKRLKEESIIDKYSNTDYLENKFITEDDFVVGYYVDKNKLVWYIKLDNNYSDNTIYFDNLEIYQNRFLEVISKMTELKK